MMTTERNLRGATALLMLASLGACSEATELDVLDDSLLEDVALVAADATLEDITLMSSQFSFGGLGSLAEGDGVPRDGSFSGTRSVTFYDADGVEQDSYDPITTASMHILHEFEGEASRDGWSASVYRSRDMVASGLEGEETTRQWDGTGEQMISRSRHLDDGTDRTYEMSGTSTKEAVVVPAPGTSDHRWPLSGTITRVIHVVVVNGPDGDVDRNVTVVITFDGDDSATAVVDGGETFEIDLTTERGRNPLRRHRRDHAG